MTSPSCNCCTVAPTAVSTSSRACSRSVSWPRRCPMPVSREGPSASAHSAASTGASSPTSPGSATSGRIPGPPVTCRPSPVRSTRAPIAVSSRSSCAPGWVVTSGQSRTLTPPPVTSAAARNGAALEISGSITRSSAATVPGRTRQPRGVAATSTPCSRSVVTVISTCGIDGTPPASARSTPSSKRAAASSRPETICEDSVASTVIAPPVTPPVPRTVNGARPRPPSSTSTPSARSAASSPALGRSRTRGSPSKATGPSASAATGGRKRSTVPASPTSTAAGPRSRPGVTCQSGPSSSTPTPSTRRPPAIRSVSRARSGRTSRLGPSASAAGTSARAGIDLEPGSRTTASTGSARRGVAQMSVTASILPNGPWKDPVLPAARRLAAVAWTGPRHGRGPFSAGLRLGRLLRREHPGQLPVGELEHAELGQLAAVAGGLHAAEGRLGRRAGRLVDPDHPGLDPVGHRPGPVQVAGEHGRAQPEPAVVGQLDGLLLVGHLVDDGGRAEQLLGVRPHLRRDVGEDRRLDEGAGVLRAPAAGDHRRTLVDRVLDLRVQVLGRLLARQRGQRGRRVAGVAGGEGGERLLESLDEGLVDVLGDDQPLGRDAGLAGVLHPAHRGGLDGAAEVLGVEHDERVAAAELEHRLLQVLAGQRRHAAAGPLAPGQGDALDVGVGDDLLDVGDPQEHVGVDALGRAGVAEELLERERALRVQLGVLEQDRVAQHQVRPGHPHHLVERVVPRLDRQQDADRLVLDHRLALHDLDRARLEEARAVLRVVVEDAGGQLHLTGRLLDPLAHLAGHQGGELVLALEHQLRGAADDLRPLLDRAAAPVEEGRVRLLDHAVDRPGLEEGELLLGLAGVGGDRRVLPGGRVARGLGVLGRGVLRRCHVSILVVVVGLAPAGLPGRGARSRRSPDLESGVPPPGQEESTCVVATPPVASPRTSWSSSRRCAPRASRRCRPTTTWRPPRTCTSSGTRRSATPVAARRVRGTGSCAPSAGAWCPPGPRTSRWATGCSTRGWSR